MDWFLYDNGLRHERVNAYICDLFYDIDGLDFDPVPFILADSAHCAPPKIKS